MTQQHARRRRRPPARPAPRHPGALRRRSRQRRSPTASEPFRELLRLLAVHEAVEEELVHPYVKRRVEGAKEAVAERVEEEREVNKMLAALDALGPTNPGFEELFTRFRTALLAHADKEESTEFAGIRSATRPAERAAMAAAVRLASALAPDAPAPRQRVRRPRAARRNADGDDGPGAGPAPRAPCRAGQGATGRRRRPRCRRPAAALSSGAGRPPTTSRSGRGTTPRAASIRRAFRRVTTIPTTANSQTGYWTSQATRNASGVKPPSASRTAPIVARTSRLARNPPRLTMLWARPRFGVGLDVRAMSKPTTEPGPPAASTITSTTSSQRGAVPGRASTADHDGHVRGDDAQHQPGPAQRVPPGQEADHRADAGWRRPRTG